MKHFLLLAFAALIYGMVGAQPCAGYNSDTLAFEDYNNPMLSGFAGSEALPCVQSGVLAHVALPFRVFDSVMVSGMKMPVQRMRLEGVSNLPCGMCWSLSPGQNPYVAGEYSAILLQGAATGDVGQYEVQVLLSFDTDGDGVYEVLNVSLADLTGVPLIVRVIGPDDVCVAVDVNVAGVVCE